MSTEPTTKEEYFDSVQKMIDEADDEGEIIRIDDDIDGDIGHHYVAYYKGKHANFFTRELAQSWIDRQKSRLTSREALTDPSTDGKTWGMA